MRSGTIFTHPGGRATATYAGAACVLSLASAWSVADGHATFVATAFVAMVAATAVATRPAGTLLAAIALITIVPYWYSAWVPQLTLGRVAPALALAALGISVLHHRSGQARLTFIDVAVSLYVAAAVASWITSSTAADSFRAMLFAVLPVAFYFATRSLGRPVLESIFTVLFSAGVVASLSLFYELFVAHRPIFLDTNSYLWTGNSELIFRPGGVFGSPPAAATVLAMTTISGYPLLRRSRGRRRMIVGAGIVLSACAVFGTFTRAGMIGLAAGTVLYTLIVPPRRPGRVVFAIAAGLIVLLFVVLPEVSHTAWYQHGVLRRGTFAGREFYWRSAWPLATNTPSHVLFGHGINSLIAGRPGVSGQPPADLRSVPTLVAIGPHNQYVRTLLEQGIVGLALVLSWLVGSVVRGSALARQRRSKDGSFIAAAAAATLSFAVVSLAGDAMREVVALAVVGVLTAAIAGAAETRESDR